MSAQLALLSAPTGPAARPFVKWAGGKTRLLPALLPLIPAIAGTYFEPFMGGAALFWALRSSGRAPRAGLADLNPRLVGTYVGLRDHLDEVVDRLLVLVGAHSAAHYYEQRAAPPHWFSSASMAAWFVYMNRAGFNGPYRENAKGELNVPDGRRATIAIDWENLRVCSRHLQGVAIDFSAFSLTCGRAQRGDFVYLDPPYVPLSETASFAQYTKAGFGWEDLLALAEVARGLVARGVGVMLSNHDTPEVRRLFEGFELHAVDAPRAIAARGPSRTRVAELVIVGHP